MVKQKTLIYWLIVGIFIVMVTGFIWLFLQPKAEKIVNNATTASIQPQNSNSLRSSDGTMTLTVKNEKQTSQTQKYSFIVTDNKTNIQQSIYSKIASSSSSFSIPHNSWSPDNKYVFVKEQNLDGQLTFLVLKTNGEGFSTGERYLDVGVYFIKKLPKYIMSDITGWASPTLLIVYTKTPEGTKGPSFWFEVTSTAFMQLSS